MLLKVEKNGNIQTLLRHGDNDAVDYEFVIDNLEYSYHPQNPNLLMKVFDASNSPQGFKDDTTGIDDTTDDYTYDANGNMKSDANKGIESIVYNHLNLPTKIFFGNGNSISYLYTANGQKVRKNVDEIVNNQAIYNVTDYLAGFQYHNAVLKHFPHAEGYVNVVKNASSYDFKYVFNYTDHLGNVHLSYTQDPETNVLKILEENHYYPFGLKHTGYNSDEFVVKGTDFTLGVLGQEMNTSLEDAVSIPFEIIPKGNNGNSNAYKYKYNGKEYQDELGLNFYDYGARNYDPALGRWMNVDPLAETSRRWSTYNYAYNNPMYFVDPDGMQSDDWKKTACGEYVYDPNLNKDNQSTQLNEGDTYVGKSVTVTTGTDSNNDGKIDSVSSQHKLNDDGSVTDTMSSTNLEPGQTVSLDTGSTITATGTLESETASVPLALGLATGALQGMAVDVAVPEPSDLAPQKWVAYAVVAVVAGAVVYSYNDSSTTTIGHYDSMSRSGDYGQEAEHTKGARPSTKTKHEKGQTRKGRDKGGEKGDARRRRYK